MNTYGYARQNAIRYFDADGLEVRFICRLLAGRLGEVSGQKHCFVYITCHEEGWSRVLSLFSTSLYTGRKSLSTPGTQNLTDNPNSPKNTDDLPMEPLECLSKICAYEKDVIEKFLSFPSADVPYFPLGQNSNSFAEGLITSPKYGTNLSNGSVHNAPGLGYN